jgi:hypothetical protein
MVYVISCRPSSRVYQMVWLPDNSMDPPYSPKLASAKVEEQEVWNVWKQWASPVACSSFAVEASDDLYCLDLQSLYGGGKMYVEL